MPDTHKEFEKKNQNFGTKVDFFPIGKFRIQNFRNIKKFISAQLHIKKIKKKFREPFAVGQSLPTLRVGLQVRGVAGRYMQTTSALFLRCTRLSTQNVQD